MKEKPLPPFSFTIDHDAMPALRVIRQRLPDAPVRGGFISPDFDCILLTVAGLHAGMAQLLVRGDTDTPLTAGPTPDVKSAEILLTLPNEDVEGFARGEGRIETEGIQLAVKHRVREEIDFKVVTAKPLVIVRNSTFQDVVKGAQRSNGRNFAYPNLVDLFRGLRSLRGSGAQAGLWQVGLGQKIEAADSKDLALERRLAGRPSQGYRSSHIGSGDLVERRPSRR